MTYTPLPSPTSAPPSSFLAWMAIALVPPPAGCSVPPNETRLLTISPDLGPLPGRVNCTESACGRFSMAPTTCFSSESTTRTRALCRCWSWSEIGAAMASTVPSLTAPSPFLPPFPAPAPFPRSLSAAPAAFTSSPGEPGTVLCDVVRCTRTHSRSRRSPSGVGSGVLPMFLVSLSHVCSPSPPSAMATPPFSSLGSDCGSDACVRSSPSSTELSAAARYQLPRSSSPWSCPGAHPA
mmetsp:Transcript_24761/g.84708  ORF Transcript_24761/g.84708 Transcript_24761/m.84708 type:complete len:237 (-) Transcript_24761:605-1315(-)